MVWRVSSASVQVVSVLVVSIENPGEFFLGNSVLGAPLSLPDVGFDAVAVDDEFFLRVVNVSRRSEEFDVVIVSVFVSLVGNVVHSRVEKEGSFRVVPVEREFGVATVSLKIMEWSVFDTLLIGIKTTFRVLEGHQTETSSHENRNIFPELGSFNREEVTTSHLGLNDRFGR